MRLTFFIYRVIREDTLFCIINVEVFQIVDR